jgi:hypothetical protein
MVARRKESERRHGWLRAAVIVVLVLGLASLIVSALISGHRTVPQQTSDPFISREAQTAQTAVSDVITPATGIRLDEIGLKSGSVQSSSTTARNSVNMTKQNKLSAQSQHKGQTIKSATKSLRQRPTQSNAKTRTTKAQITQVKPQPSTSAPSDELFPELRSH